jgi:heptaprenyl diphosphate synthase
LQLGKPTGNDLKQGNLTLPVIHAMVNSPHGGELREMIFSRDLSADRLARCLDIVREGDSVEYAYAQANRFLQEARNMLPRDLDSEVRVALTTVADFIGLRKY